MQIQQFTVSRLTQFQQQQKNNPNVQNTQTQSNNYQNVCFLINAIPQQFKKLKHIPMFKLGFNNIFIKNQNSKNFVKKQLSLNQTQNHLNQFNQMRQKHQNHIYLFIKKYANNYSSLDDIEEMKAATDNLSQIMRNTSVQQSNYGSQFNKKIINSPLSPLRSKTSSKKYSQGGYFFNNWRSYQSYYCINAKNAHSEKPNLVANLVYAVLDMDYDMALKIIQTINQTNGISYEFSKTSQNQSQFQGKVKQIQINVKKQKKTKHHQTKQKISFQLNSLKIILKGLKTLFSVIKIVDQYNQNTQLSQTFFNRDQFNLLQDHYINDPKVKINLFNLSNVEELEKSLTREYSDSFNQSQYEQKNQLKKFDKKQSSNLTRNSPKNQPQKILKSTQNLMTYKLNGNNKRQQINEDLRKFIELPSKYQKICILNNLVFIINFTKKIKIQSCENDYYKLLFTFLKNGQDQLQDMHNMSSKYHINFDDKKSKLKNVPQELSDQFSNQSESGNNVQSNQLNFKSQIDYINLLLQLQGLKIYDRINFATRLLSKQKKIIFVQRLQHKVLKYSTLDNLLIFTKFYKQQIMKSLEQLNSFHYIKEEKQLMQQKIKIRKNSSEERLPKIYTQHQLQRETKLMKKSLEKSLQNKQQLGIKIKSICQNYIDKYGDLATVAYLSNQYPCLSQFSQFYRQSLLLSYESQQVQKLDMLKLKSLDQGSQKKINLPVKRSLPFLYDINFKTQRVNDDIHEQMIQGEVRKCEICNLKVFQDKKQCYIQCSKCRHGGHLDHIIKWYNNYQNCPNINCPCLCN